MAEKSDLKISKLQEDFFERLRKIDSSVLVELKIKSPGSSSTSPMWSDWHDRWKDRGGGWSDGFGKAGKP